MVSLWIAPQVSHRFIELNGEVERLQASPKGRVLVVEDEPAIVDVITTALRRSGYLVESCADGQQGLDQALSSRFDLIVMDVMLPIHDGFEVCAELRRRGETVPVLFLTARDAPQDRIQGFVEGGDDYVTKPFHIDELVLRVAAILRRDLRLRDEEVLSLGDLLLNSRTRDVRRGADNIRLTPREFDLLEYLMENADHVVSKAQILDVVWGGSHEGSDNVVELYIGYLRRKIDDFREPMIQTRRGVGYLIRAPQS